MTRRPPRSTRTDTLFPYTTLFRSDLMRFGAPEHIRAKYQARAAVDNRDIEVLDENWCAVDVFLACGTQCRVIPMGGMQGIDYTGLQSTMAMMAVDDVPTVRSEERSVGKEGVRTCRSRWSPDH